MSTENEILEAVRRIARREGTSADHVMISSDRKWLTPNISENDGDICSRILEAQLAEVEAAHELDCQLRDMYRGENLALKQEVQEHRKWDSDNANNVIITDEQHEHFLALSAALAKKDEALRLMVDRAHAMGWENSPYYTGNDKAIKAGREALALTPASCADEIKQLRNTLDEFRQALVDTHAHLMREIAVKELNASKHDGTQKLSWRIAKMLDAENEARADAGAKET